MPLEIKELVIKTRVVDAETQSSGDAKSGHPSTSSTKISAVERQKIIEECVEAILRILEIKKDR